MTTKALGTTLLLEVFSFQEDLHIKNQRLETLEIEEDFVSLVYAYKKMFVAHLLHNYSNCL